MENFIKNNQMNKFINLTLYDLVKIDKQLEYAHSEGKIDIEKCGILSLSRKILDTIDSSPYKYILNSPNPDTRIPKELQNKIMGIYDKISRIYFSITGENITL